MNTTIPSSRRLAQWAVFGAALFPTLSLATDGYFSTAYGVRSRGMAGVSIALPHDATAAANNPAGMVWLDRRWDASLELFIPYRHYAVDGAPSGMGGFLPGTVYSGENFFVIPTFGVVFPQKDGGAIGVTLDGNGGMNTSYPADANGGFGTFGSGATGVNLEQAFLSVSYSRKVSERASVGASLIYGLQRFSAKGLQAFNPGSDRISNNGVDWSQGFGVKLGVQSEVAPGLTVGAVYSPKMKMERFDRYSELFADGGNFDIPEHYGVGLAYRPDSKSVIGFDVKQINYSGVTSVGNPGASGYPLGHPNGPGFGWRDMTVYKLGYEWEAREGLRLRAGVSYGRQPIRSSDVLFNILAPGVQEWHFAGGFTQTLKDGGEFSMALVYSPKKTVSGPNPMDPAQTIRLSMHQFELELGYSKKF
ncbi:MAG: outer membrane protein transport protein [Fimbriimonadales bacterium]|nr:outer membrane protein transport protein [Fimbriimonadales bacterium]